jgi:GNAT superfamily N-acetyltransferase
MTIQIHQVDTTNRREVKQFVRFPFHLYKGCSQWVPPLVSSATKQLDRRRHSFYTHSDAGFFLVLQNGKVIGRIAVLEPRKRNTYREEKGAFFYLFEAIDDTEVSRALFNAAFEWAQERGLDRISGPEGFGAGDSLGALVKGFEHRPAMGQTYNYDYYDRMIKDSGFEKQTDYYSAYLDGDMVLPERIDRIAERVKKRRGFRVLHFHTQDEMRAVAPKVVEAYNAAFSENRDFVPVSGADAERIANRLISMTKPHLVKAVAKGDEIAGFVLGFPDVSAALQRCRGRLYPFGWAMLMRESKNTEWINFNGGGVLPQYQGSGAIIVLYQEIYRMVKEQGFRHIDVVQVNEQNQKMVEMLELLDVDLYKAHRIYERAL